MTRRDRGTPSERSPGVPRWISASEPPVPEGLARWLAGPGVPRGAVRPEVDTLVGSALRQLDAVRGGTSRDAAFRLLGADALLTWACEAALEGTAPGEVMEEVARRVAAGTDGPA